MSTSFQLDFLQTYYPLIQHTMTDLGLSPNTFTSRPSTGSLILLAHSPPPLLERVFLSSDFLPVLLTSLQTNIAMDESLSVILISLSRIKSQSNKDLSPDVVVPLSSVLSSLSSAHPDPSTRHLTFRALSLMLSLTPSPLRLKLLNDLIVDADFPQMRVASISLVKEAVLEALSSCSPNVFTSPLFLQTLVPSLFRPPLLDSLSVHDLDLSLEIPRLVETLGLYHILLRRDKDNRVIMQSIHAI